jgi:hypothetical protein
MLEMYDTPRTPVGSKIEGLEVKESSLAVCEAVSTSSVIVNCLGILRLTPIQGD